MLRANVPVLPFARRRQRPWQFHESGRSQQYCLFYYICLHYTAASMCAAVTWLLLSNQRRLHSSQLTAILLFPEIGLPKGPGNCRKYPNFQLERRRPSWIPSDGFWPFRGNWTYGAPAYQISTKSGNARLSYWWFNYFSACFNGISNQPVLRAIKWTELNKSGRSSALSTLF